MSRSDEGGGGAENPIFSHRRQCNLGPALSDARQPNRREFRDLHTPYTGYAGWHVTEGIPVKFATAHDRPIPDVGSTKCI